MALSTWWRGDSMPELPAHSGFTIHRAGNDMELAAVNSIDPEEICRRRSAGHTPYIGRWSGVVVTYGWVATRTADIGELELRFDLPAEDCYLWDFATLPQWQGHGLYPRLLQGIIRQETAERFWIIYAPENLPSGAGIEKAGFARVGQLSFRQDGTLGLAPLKDMSDRAKTGAALLNVPLLEGELNPCWRCMDKVVCICQRDPESCACALPVRRSQTSSTSLHL